MTHKLGGVDFVDNLMIVSGKSLVEGEKKREQNHRQQHLWWFGRDSRTRYGEHCQCSAWQVDIHNNWILVPLHSSS